MSNQVIDKSLNNAALIAGLGLLIMTIFAVGAIYFIFPKLIIANDALLTANNIIANETQFRLGILSLIIVAVCDVVVAWALYVFLRQVNKNLSLLAAWFRLVYSIILLAALLNLTEALHIYNGNDYLNSFETSQLYSLAMLSINAFNSDWAVGLIFFGIHLIVIGYLILKSDYVPGILGIILVLAGAAYLTDNLSLLIIPSSNLIFATFIGWGELILMFWLLYQSIKLPTRQAIGQSKLSCFLRRNV